MLANSSSLVFPKQVVDPFFDDIDCWPKFLFYKKLVEAKLFVLRRLERLDSRADHSICCIFVSRSCSEVSRKLLSFATRLEDRFEEIAQIHRLLDYSVQLENGLLQAPGALPSYINERPKKLLKNNELQDILKAQSALKIKYEVDRYSLLTQPPRGPVRLAGRPAAQPRDRRAALPADRRAEVRLRAQPAAPDRSPDPHRES